MVSLLVIKSMTTTMTGQYLILPPQKQILLILCMFTSAQKGHTLIKYVGYFDYRGITIGLTIRLEGTPEGLTNMLNYCKAQFILAEDSKQVDRFLHVCGAIDNGTSKPIMNTCGVLPAAVHVWGTLSLRRGILIIISSLYIFPV